MGDYDFYLRDLTVRGGEWTGFALAWKGLGNIQGLSGRPRRMWYPWNSDPAHPNDPTMGARGVLQWQFDIASVGGLVGPEGMPPADGRTASDMRGDLQAFMALSALDLKDSDGTVYRVRMTEYSEEQLAINKAAQEGGVVVRVEFARVII